MRTLNSSPVMRTVSILKLIYFCFPLKAHATVIFYVNSLQAYIVLYSYSYSYIAYKQDK